MNIYKNTYIYAQLIPHCATPPPVYYVPKIQPTLISS